MPVAAAELPAPADSPVAVTSVAARVAAVDAAAAEASPVVADAVAPSWKLVPRTQRRSVQEYPVADPPMPASSQT